MAWILFFLTFLSYHSGVSSQPPWVQPASESVSLGGTAKLSCAATKDSYAIFWYQQKTGQAPRYVHYAGGSRGEGIPDRFTASQPGNTGFLTITNVQADDEADYYCAKWHSSGTQRIFGGGTQLTVSGGPRSPPTVNLYCPPKEQMASEGKATLVCSITDFSPSPMETTWEVGGTAVSNGVQTTKPIKDNGKYMTSSYMTTTASDWERGDSFTCKVRHEGIDYVKTVSQSQCP